MLRRALVVLAGFLLLAASSGTALAMGAGVEIGGTLAHNNSGLPPDQNSFALGVIIDNTFNVTLVDFTLWADLQTLQKVPILNTSGEQATSYIPADLGLRVGLALPVEPYVGLLIGGMFHSGPQPTTLTGKTAPDAIFTVGGDLGADVVVGPVRVGLELRGSSLTGQTEVFPDTWVWQLLASARFSF
jgi:hypothetical protein